MRGRQRRDNRLGYARKRAFHAYARKRAFHARTVVIPFHTQRCGGEAGCEVRKADSYLHQQSLNALSLSLACQGGCDERKRPTVELSVEASGRL